MKRSFLIFFIFLLPTFILSKDYVPNDDLYFEKRDIKKHIKNKVKTELTNKLIEKINQDYERHLFYKIPSWPIESIFFLKKDLISARFDGLWATQAYGSSGGTKDISKVIFGSDTIRLKDIVLASRLIEEGKLALSAGMSNKYNFLTILKDQIFDFDASIDRQEVALSYVRNFEKSDVSLGLDVPIVRRSHELKLVSNISTVDRNTLIASASEFDASYPNGLSDLFAEILSKKKIGFNQHDDEVGIGDVKVFANLELNSKSCERCFLGVKAVFPTSKRRDIYKLWDPELGNGGFFEFAAFGSVLFSKSKLFNPHLFAEFTYFTSGDASRRVPKIVSSDDIEDPILAQIRFDEDFMIYGNSVKWVSDTATFTGPDSNVARFADASKKIRIHKGPELLFRIGNIITNVFSEKGFIDFFYDIKAKGKDYVGFQPSNRDYDISGLTKNSYEIRHRVGFDFNRWLDETWRASFGGRYVFAGRNTLRAFELAASIGFEF